MAAFVKCKTMKIAGAFFSTNCDFIIYSHKKRKDLSVSFDYA